MKYNCFDTCSKILRFRASRQMGKKEILSIAFCVQKPYNVFNLRQQLKVEMNMVIVFVHTQNI